MSSEYDKEKASSVCPDNSTVGFYTSCYNLNNINTIDAPGLNVVSNDTET
jgi:hypothetical protein